MCFGGVAFDEEWDVLEGVCRVVVTLESSLRTDEEGRVCGLEEGLDVVIFDTVFTLVGAVDGVVLSVVFVESVFGSNPDKSEVILDYVVYEGVR